MAISDTFPPGSLADPIGKIYISGPMSGIESMNYPAFDEAEAQLVAENWEVVNPAQLDRDSGTLSREDYMRRDIEALLECDWIYMLPGWHNSPGARAEYQVAIECSMGVVYSKGAERGATPEFTAANLVRNGERQKVYGHPRKDFDRTGLLWSGILGVTVTAHDVALMMAALKISRLKSTPEHADSVVDLIGYAVAYDRLKEAQ
ncbi:DUF4406 domain-containing protein [Streptomyces sp. NPDC002855]|uniref:DUF4406 domain-containing protein n=1 Tax=Streptomyces sp. NPDC002855 TaxID=3154437 RepID=UPI00332D653F